MADVLATTGVKIKREAVKLGLKTLLMRKQQEPINTFNGRLKREGDLNRLRLWRCLGEQRFSGHR
jgi:Arc/MetJ family transcription regulator